MLELLSPAFAVGVTNVLHNLASTIWPYLLIALGFSAVIFVHELGHFLVAKWADVRVEKFAIGFGREIVGFTRGETRYSLNILPLGGYVKMLGQEDFDDKTNEWKVKDDPRAFSNKPVGARMAIVSAGVVMNVIFAALLFMVVMLIGVRVGVPIVGPIQPNSPAALAGLEPGDEVLRIDGKEVKEFTEISFAIMLNAPHEPMDFEIRRDGEIKHLRMTPMNDPNRARGQQLGFSVALTRKIAYVGPSLEHVQNPPKVADTIVALNGKPLTDEDINRINLLFGAIAPDPIILTLERTSAGSDAKNPQRFNFEFKPELRVEGPDPQQRDFIHVLGLSPLIEVSSVEPGSPAEKAGVKIGDVVLKVGEVSFPTQADVLKVVQANANREVATDVLRTEDGQTERLQLMVRPRVKFKLWGHEPAKIGIGFAAAATHIPQIGTVVAESKGAMTPAARAGIPSGAHIERIGGATVHDWAEMIEALRRHAGSDVEIAYRDLDDQEHTTLMPVPHCLRTKLGLPAVSRILAVDGIESYRVEYAGSKKDASIGNAYVLGEFLKTRVGRTVSVKYRAHYGDEAQTAEVQITDDMLDQWLGQINYDFDFNLAPAPRDKLLKISNPAAALWAGTKKAYYFVAQVYTVMQRMIFSRSVSVDSLSGPVGIFKMGSEVAQTGLSQMLLFLGIISANLAVLNFLPLPIVDGGLMVFLIIEKIKRRPVSLKVQMITQVIGLFLIITALVMVTIQDLTK
jgi:regulator of sigma E protease